MADKVRCAGKENLGDEGATNLSDIAFCNECAKLIFMVWSFIESLVLINDAARTYRL